MRTFVILTVIIISLSMMMYSRLFSEKPNTTLPQTSELNLQANQPTSSNPVSDNGVLKPQLVDKNKQQAISSTPSAKTAQPISEAQVTQVLQTRECRKIPATQQAFDRWLEQATQNDEPSEYMENVITLFEQCSQIARTENYIDVLIKAAEQGNHRAIYTLWFLDRLELRQTNMPQREWLAWLYQYSSQHAGWGNEKLALRLVTEYQRYDPQTGGQSYAKAVAWAQWVKHISDDSQLYARADWYEQKLYPQLTANEIEQAAQLFSAIKQRYQQHQPP